MIRRNENETERRSVGRGGRYQAVPERRKTTANQPAINAAAMMMRYFVFSDMRSNIVKAR